METLELDHTIIKEFPIAKEGRPFNERHEQGGLDLCPDCGANLRPDGRCRFCATCGWCSCS